MKIMLRKVVHLFMVTISIQFVSLCAYAGEVQLNGLTIGAGFSSVNIQSFQARKFSTTIKQEYDFSCGSAALATLLTFSYHIPSSEADVFSSMFRNGDQSVIRQSGFSLLDMKNYLSRIGLQSAGFNAPLSKLEDVQLPAIVLINEHGYRHFVVIRGVQEDRVLLADPAIGLRAEKLADFQAQWSGIFFVILDDVSVGQESFDDEKGWSSQPVSPTGLSRFAVTLTTLQQVNFADPSRF